MSFLDDLRNNLTPDLFTQVTDALGDDFNYDVVPRSRLNKVIGQRDKYKKELDESTGTQQLEGPHSGNEGNSNPQGKPNEGQPTVEELRKQFETEKNNAIQGLRIQYAGLDALRAANAVDADLAFTLLDKSKMTIGEDGKLAGIAEQITALQESKPFLFTKAAGSRNNTPGGTGKTGGDDPFETVKSKADFLKLSTTDQMKFKDAHPDVFKHYLEQ